MDSGRVLITGGSGFIGTNLVDHYLRKGCEVLDLSVTAPLKAENAKVWKQLDLLDAAGLTREVAEFRPEVVVHLGARTDMHGLSAGEYSANTDGVRNILRAVNSVSSVSRIALASSRLVFRIDHRPAHDYDYTPTTTYGQSKVAGEQIVLKEFTAGVPWIIFRPTSIWGPWFGIPYRTFFDTIAKGKYLHPRGRKVEKTFGYVGNVVHEIVGLLKAPLPSAQNKVFFAADYQPIEVRSFAERVRQELNAPAIREVPVSLLRAAAWTGDALKVVGWKNPPITSFRLDNLLTRMVYDMSATESVVGPLPFTTEEGIRQTVAWMKSAG